MTIKKQLVVGGWRSVMTRRMVVAGVLAALWCGSVWAELVVATNGTLNVTEATTITGPTNIYYNGTSGHTISADLTLKNKTFLRLMGDIVGKNTTYLDIGPTSGSGKVTISTDAKSGLYGTYRNAKIEDSGQSSVMSYIRARIGEHGGSATFDISGYVQPVGYTGFQTPQFGAWFERVEISANATTDGDYFDIVTVNAGGRFNTVGLYNNGPKPARILFNGGRVDIWYINGGNNDCIFRAAKGKPLYLTSLNGNPINFYKTAKTVEYMTYGDGTIYAQGPEFRLDSNSNSYNNGTTGENQELRWKYRTGASVFDWSGLTGDIVLGNKSALYVQGNDMLHWGKGTGILRMECTAAPAAGTQDSARLVLEGATTNHLNGIVALGSQWQYACVTNDNTSGKVATVILGAGDVDCVLAANVMTNVNIVKVGTGTLTISNCTVVGEVSVEAGFVRRVNSPTIGKFTVGNNAYELVESAQTWTNGGTDNLLANPANWGAAKVDLYTGLMTATFGEAGTEAEVAALAKLKGIVLSLSNFAFTGSQAIELGAGGISANNGAANYAVRCPLALTADQSWTVAAGDTLFVNGGISGEASITKSGAGTLYLSGNVNMTNIVHSETAGDGSVIMSNAVITADVRTTCLTAKGFYCAPNTTNEIRGKVYSYGMTAKGGHSNFGINVGKDATLIISGGAEFHYTTTLGQAGTMIITNKPVSADSWLASSASGSKLVFAVSSNNVQYLYGGLSSSTTEFLVDDVFDPVKMATAENGIVAYRSSRPLYIHRTHQSIAGISTSVATAQGTINGDYPAQIDLLMRKSYYSAVDLVGWISLMKGGIAGTTQSISNVAVSSYGDLSVTNGTLRFFAKDPAIANSVDASWLNGTNVTVKGNGILQLDHGKVFNNSYTTLKFEDNGKVAIPNVVTQELMSVMAPNAQGVLTDVPAGTYDKNSTGLMQGRITGEGAIKVRAGMFMIVF